jgi:hypothetical protein
VITIAKPVRRCVFDAHHGELVVTMRPEGIEVREKGRRTTYGPVTYGFVFLTGARMRAEETRKQRRAQRRGGRQSK